MTLDAKSEAWVRRVVEQAPPLSQRQQDLIAAAFRGAIKAPGDGQRPSDTHAVPAPDQRAAVLPVSPLPAPTPKN
jgi:hypothetical protein